MNGPENYQFDAIVIGSGVGGLAAASLLSRLSKLRALVIEKHSIADGLLNSHLFS